MMADIGQTIAEFEKGRAHLAGISMQKQQLQMQSEALSQTLEELKNTKEEKVFKLAGTVLLQAPLKEVQKDVETKKESVDLRSKTVQKQEEILIDKLNKLKAEIEKVQRSSSGSKGFAESEKN